MVLKQNITYGNRIFKEFSIFWFRLTNKIFNFNKFQNMQHCIFKHFDKGLMLKKQNKDI